MTIHYTPKGVCSKKFQIEVEAGIIRNVQVTGGCSGNLQGLSALLKGMTVEEAISRMEGIRCGPRPTLSLIHICVYPACRRMYACGSYRPVS